MFKKIFFLNVLFLSGFLNAMQNLGHVRTDVPLGPGMGEALEKSKTLLPTGIKTCGYRNEEIADTGTLCCVPLPEPELYADELLHLQDAQPLDKKLATILAQKYFQHSGSSALASAHKALEKYNDERTALQLAKAIATKVGRPYKVLPASLLNPHDLWRLLDALNKKDTPCTIILHELNNQEDAALVRTFIDRYQKDYCRFSGISMPKIHIIITTKLPQWSHHYATMFECVKPLNCQERTRLLRYHLEQLPIQPDETYDQDYLTTIAQKTAGLSAAKLEDFVGNVLLHALSAQDIEGDLQEQQITRDDFETVLKDSYSIGQTQNTCLNSLARFLG